MRLVFLTALLAAIALVAGAAVVFLLAEYLEPAPPLPTAVQAPAP